MNIAVNGRFLVRPVTGVERYGREILHRLAPANLRVIPAGRWRRGIGGHAWEQLILPGQLHPEETLWSPANTGPLMVKNQVLTLHDLSPLEHPEWYAAPFAWWYRFFVPRLVRQVKQIAVSSEYMRHKLIGRFSLTRAAVSVVPGGVDLDRFKPNIDPPGGLPESYVLFVGSLQPRKNLGVLLNAWKAIQPRFPETWLLAAGAGDTIFRRAALTDKLDHLRWLGYAPEADLPGLYAGAALFVYPSLEEGFGLPLLEAMACGTPVIAARSGALPEVAGEAALWFDPADASELAEALGRGLTDTALRHSLAAKGLERARSFAWERSAERMREVLQQCR